MSVRWTCRSRIHATSRIVFSIIFPSSETGAASCCGSSASGIGQDTQASRHPRCEVSQHRGTTYPIFLYRVSVGTIACHEQRQHPESWTRCVRDPPLRPRLATHRTSDAAARPQSRAHSLCSLLTSRDTLRVHQAGGSAACGAQAASLPEVDQRMAPRRTPMLHRC